MTIIYCNKENEILNCTMKKLDELSYFYRLKIFISAQFMDDIDYMDDNQIINLYVRAFFFFFFFCIKYPLKLISKTTNSKKYWRVGRCTVFCLQEKASIIYWIYINEKKYPHKVKLYHRGKRVFS